MVSKSRRERARPNISQFRSLEIRRTTFLNYINLANLLIFEASKLRNVRSGGERRKGSCSRCNGAAKNLMTILIFLSLAFPSPSLRPFFLSSDKWRKRDTYVLVLYISIGEEGSFEKVGS